MGFAQTANGTLPAPVLMALISALAVARGDTTHADAVYHLRVVGDDAADLRQLTAARLQPDSDTRASWPHTRPQPGRASAPTAELRAASGPRGGRTLGSSQDGAADTGANRLPLAEYSSQMYFSPRMLDVAGVADGANGSARADAGRRRQDERTRPGGGGGDTDGRLQVGQLDRRVGSREKLSLGRRARDDSSSQLAALLRLTSWEDQQAAPSIYFSPELARTATEEPDRRGAIGDRRDRQQRQTEPSPDGPARRGRPRPKLEPYRPESESSRPDARARYRGTRPSPRRRQPAPRWYTGCPSTKQDPDGDCIRGDADRDYPTLDRIPRTSFSCSGRSPGFYADVETHCQVWHYCTLRRVQQTFLCNRGTVFNQKHLVCDWWYSVDCEHSDAYHYVNDRLYTGRHEPPWTRRPSLARQPRPAPSDSVADVPAGYIQISGGRPGRRRPGSAPRDPRPAYFEPPHALKPAYPESPRALRLTYPEPHRSPRPTYPESPRVSRPVYVRPPEPAEPAPGGRRPAPVGGRPQYRRPPVTSRQGAPRRYRYRRPGGWTAAPRTYTASGHLIGTPRPTRSGDTTRPTNPRLHIAYLGTTAPDNGPAPGPYSYTPSAPPYSFTPNPRSHSSTPSPRSYITITNPTSYSTTPHPRPYSSTSNPQPYSSISGPRPYSSTLGPRPYSSTSDPRPYGSVLSSPHYHTPSPTERPYTSTQIPGPYDSSPPSQPFTPTPRSRHHTSGLTPQPYRSTKSYAPSSPIKPTFSPVSHPFSSTTTSRPYGTPSSRPYSQTPSSRPDRPTTSSLPNSWTPSSRPNSPKQIPRPHIQISTPRPYSSTQTQRPQTSSPSSQPYSSDQSSSQSPRPYTSTPRQRTYVSSTSRRPHGSTGSSPTYPTTSSVRPLLSPSTPDDPSADRVRPDRPRPPAALHDRPTSPSPAAISHRDNIIPPTGERHFTSSREQKYGPTRNKKYSVPPPREEAVDLPQHGHDHSPSQLPARQSENNTVSTSSEEKRNTRPSSKTYSAPPHAERFTSSDHHENLVSAPHDAPHRSEKHANRLTTSSLEHTLSSRPKRPTSVLIVEHPPHDVMTELSNGIHSHVARKPSSTRQKARLPRRRIKVRRRLRRVFRKRPHGDKQESQGQSQKEQESHGLRPEGQESHLLRQEKQKASRHRPRERKPHRHRAEEQETSRYRPDEEPQQHRQDKPRVRHPDERELRRRHPEEARPSTVAATTSASTPTTKPKFMFPPFKPRHGQKSGEPEFGMRIGKRKRYTG